MSRVRFGRGNAAVELDQPDAAQLIAQLEDALGPVLTELQAVADQILADLQSTWPVDTGKSLGGFYTTTTILGDFSVSIDIMNDVKYARFIRSTKRLTAKDVERVRNPMQVSVIRPAKAEAKDLAKKLPDIFAKYLATKP